MPQNNNNTFVTIENLPRDIILSHLLRKLPATELIKLSQTSKFWQSNTNAYITSHKLEFEFEVKQLQGYSAERLFIQLLKDGQYVFFNDPKDLSDAQKVDNALCMLEYLVHTKKIPNINANFVNAKDGKFYLFTAVYFASLESESKPNKNYFRLFEFLLKNGAQITRKTNKTVETLSDIWPRDRPTESNTVWIETIPNLGNTVQALVCISVLEKIFIHKWESSIQTTDAPIRRSIEYDKTFFLKYCEDIRQTKKGYQITYTEKNIEFLDDLLKTILPLESPKDTTPGLAQ